MAGADSWDAESFEPEETIPKGTGTDKWEGEDEEDDVKDNWDDEEEASQSELTSTQEKLEEKRKGGERPKDRENLLRQRQEEQRRREAETQESSEPSAEDDSLEKLQEGSNHELTNDTFGGVSHPVGGIDSMSPSSRDDFNEFERLLKAKICPYDKSVHYGPFLESLLRNLCLSLDVEDMKRVSNSLTVLLTEKQKQEKSRAKKKKKGVVTAGGLKAKMKDDLDDYGDFDGGYTQDYEDFM